MERPKVASGVQDEGVGLLGLSGRALESVGFRVVPLVCALCSWPLWFLGGLES